MVTTKEVFIKRYLEMIKGKLQATLPESGFEFEMIDMANEIIRNYTGHLSDAVQGG